MKFATAVLVIILTCASSVQAFSPPRRPRATVLSVTFSPNSKVIASSGCDETVRTWDTQTGKALKVINNWGGPILRFHPTRNLLVVGDDSITLKDASTWKTIRTFKTDISPQEALFTSPNILVAAGWGIDLWNIDTGRFVRRLDMDALCVGASRDGKTLVSGGWGPDLIIWNPETGQQVRSVKLEQVDLRNVDVSPDGTTVACGGWADKVTLVNTKTGTIIRTLQLQDIGSIPVRFSPDGKQIAAGGSTGWVKVWDVSTGNVVWAAQGHTAEIESIAFSPDGRMLASGCDAGKISLWDASSGKVLRTLVGHKLGK